MLGLILLTFGTSTPVSGTAEAGRTFGAWEVVIGPTIVAIGTSLPELLALKISTRNGSRGIGR